MEIVSHRIGSGGCKHIRIAFALRSCGQLDGASRLFESIYAEASRKHLGSARAFALRRLAGIELDAGNIDQAEYWID